MILLMIIGIFYAKNILAKDYENESLITKAICDEKNYCEDYEIVCKNKQVIGLNPTGAAVQFSESWKDPRTNEERLIGCY